MIATSLRHAVNGAILLVSGCSFPDLVQRDAAGTDADPNNVHITSILTFIKLDGTVTTAPEDLSRYTLKVYLPSADNTFTVIDVVGTKEGMAEIPDVPVGTTFYLSLVYPEVLNQATPPPEMIVTNKREIDLGYPTVGRPDAAETRLSSSVQVNATNMAAWGPHDTLTVGSYNVGTQFTNMGRATNTPTVGATSVTGFSFDWRDSASTVGGRLPALVDAGKGDDIFVAHNQAELVGNGKTTYYVSKEVDVVKRTDLTQVDGMPLVVDGAFAQATANKTVNVTLQIENFRARYPDRARFVAEGHMVSEISGPAIQYQTELGPTIWSIETGAPTLFMRGLPDVFTVPALTYGVSSAYPATWAHVARTYYQPYRGYRLPGATGNGYLSTPYVIYAPITSTAVTSAPVSRPTAKIEVAGVENTFEPMAIPFDGTHGVVVEWEGVPQAEGYALIVDYVYVDGTLPAGRRILYLKTNATSAVIPPDLLERGKRYLVGVYTIWGLDDAGPRRYRLPGGQTGVATNDVLFSDACGNGVMEPDLGEECDTMGASANCDADCSLPVCGDAYTNTLAGETCDHGNNRDSFACDGDCTAIVCGDGRWNRVAEDCDDGNTMDNGNGCSATCTRVGTCGDGTVQSFFETCDPPNGTTCNAGCRPI